MNAIVLKFISYVRELKIADRIRALRIGQRASQIPRWVPWVVLAVLALLLLRAVNPPAPVRVEIPYTTFVQQVRSGNVNWVSIDDGQIRGVFRTFVHADSIQAVGPVPGDIQVAEFVTRFPPGMTDPRLLPLLDDHGVIVFAWQPQANWALRWRLVSLLPLALSLLVVPYAAVRARRPHWRAAPINVEAEEERRLDLTRSYATFIDVAGQDAAKSELSGVVEYLRRPDALLQLRAEIPPAVLLIGPPGSGKTLFAQSIAGEARVPLFRVSAFELLPSADHIVTNPIRDAFERARANAPAIVFLDDLDAISSSRSSSADPHLNQILIELDNLDPGLQLMILAAASWPDAISPVFSRRGRFQHHVFLGLPELSDRANILRAQTASMPVADDVDFDEIARKTPGLSGAELALLSRRGALNAARRQQSQISRTDFEEALAHLVMSGEVSTALLTRDQRRIAAYHEAGHGLMSLLLPGAAPLHRLSILPRVEALDLCGPTRSVQTKNQLLTCLTVMVAGRTAEELVLGDVTTGAEKDLAAATRLARRMVSRWGMSDLGPVSFNTADDGSEELSEATASQVDRSVRVLMEDRHAVARHILKNNRPILDRLAESLAHEETLDREEVLRVVGTPPPPTPDKPPAPK